MYIPLIVFGVFMVAGVVAFIVYNIRSNRAEARKWARIK